MNTDTDLLGLVEDIDLDALEARYTADEVPPCRVCGGELSIGRVGGGEATRWAHHAPDGVRMGDWTEHYANSVWTQYRSGDSEVLAVIAFVRRSVKERA